MIASDYFISAGKEQRDPRCRSDFSRVMAALQPNVSIFIEHALDDFRDQMPWPAPERGGWRLSVGRGC
jgi:hypothetical protein